MGIFVKKKGDAGSGPLPPNPTSRPWREKALRLADVERAEAEKCQFCVYSVTISPPLEESFFGDYKKIIYRRLRLSWLASSALSGIHET